jgi:hypothetical protein
MVTPALKPLLRLGLAFAVVWFYQALTSSFVSGMTQLALVVLLSVATWLVVARAVFPVNGDGLLEQYRGGRG